MSTRLNSGLNTGARTRREQTPSVGLFRQDFPDGGSILLNPLARRRRIPKLLLGCLVRSSRLWGRRQERAISGRSESPSRSKVPPQTQREQRPEDEPIAY